MLSPKLTHAFGIQDLWPRTDEEDYQRSKKLDSYD